MIRIATRGEPLCSGLRVAQTASPSGFPARLQSATHALLRRATRFAATAPQAPFAQRLTVHCAMPNPSAAAHCQRPDVGSAQAHSARRHSRIQGSDQGAASASRPRLASRVVQRAKPWVGERSGTGTRSKPVCGLPSAPTRLGRCCLGRHALAAAPQRCRSRARLRILAAAPQRCRSRARLRALAAAHYVLRLSA